MDKRIEEIIQSGVIEEYLFGTLEQEERKEVEALIAKHPELKSHLESAQEVVWNMADEMAIDPPPKVKQKIMESIKADQVQHGATGPAPSKLGWYTAMVVALLGLATTIYLQGQHRNSKNTMLADLRDCHENRLLAESTTDQLQQLLSDQTTIRVLRNETSGLEMIAYAMPESKQLALDLREAPELPRDKVLQLWGDRDGEMISIGVIDPQRDYLTDPLVLAPGFASINLTVEDAGPDGIGSDHATVSALLDSATI